MGTYVRTPAINRNLEVLWCTATITVEVREVFSSPLLHVGLVLNANLPLPCYISFSLLKNCSYFRWSRFDAPRTQVISAAPSLVKYLDGIKEGVGDRKGRRVSRISLRGVRGGGVATSSCEDWQLTGEWSYLVVYAIVGSVMSLPGSSFANAEGPHCGGLKMLLRDLWENSFSRHHSWESRREMGGGAVSLNGLSAACRPNEDCRLVPGGVISSPSTHMHRSGTIGCFPHGRAGEMIRCRCVAPSE